MKHSRSKMPAVNCCLAIHVWVSVGIFSQSLRRVGLLVAESEANVFDRPSFSLCNQIAIPAAIGTPALENMVLSNLAVSREECSIVDCRWGKGTWQKMATDSRRAFCWERATSFERRTGWGGGEVEGGWGGECSKLEVAEEHFLGLPGFPHCCQSAPG